MRIARGAMALAAGLALADASVVVLALPAMLIDLGTSVTGVAAVIGVYTLVLALALRPAAAVVRRVDPAYVGGLAAAAFAVTCAGCGLAPNLPVLVVFRAGQGLAAAGVLIAAFAVLQAGAERSAGRLWTATAIVGAAVGPALGGAITELLDWRAIFFVQAPIMALAALAVFLSGRQQRGPAYAVDNPAPLDADQPSAGQPSAGRRAGLAACLGLLSAALTGVLFLLVLLLVSGWALSPLRGAAAVSVLPVAALLGTGLHEWSSRRLDPDGWMRALAGCLLVGAGVAALGILPVDDVRMTIAPQIIAGIGMGLALPALGGTLLPERTVMQSASVLIARHLGITVALIALAPLLSANLDDAVISGRLDGAALILDAPLTSKEKISVAASAAGSFTSVAPRKDLRDALAGSRGGVAKDDRPAYDDLRHAVDGMLVATVDRSFRPAFFIGGGFAVLAALGVAALATGASARVRRVTAAGTVAALVIGGAMLGGQAALAAGKHRSRCNWPIRARSGTCPMPRRPARSTR
ncbi:MAG: MFS transporter [Mycobacteriales bacterium]